MKKSLIILGSVAAAGAALYFILKPSSAKAATPAKKKTGGGGVSTAPVKQTKDCVVSSFNCVSTSKETIQIPLDANCMDYQPAMPQCAPPMGGGYKVAPDLYNGGLYGGGKGQYLVDNDAYYSGYYDGYEPSGGLPYSGGRPPKGQYLVIRGYSDYAMKPKLGFPPSGRGDYGDVMMYSRRPAYV